MQDVSKENRFLFLTENPVIKPIGHQPNFFNNFSQGVFTPKYTTFAGAKIKEKEEEKGKIKTGQLRTLSDSSRYGPDSLKLDHSF